MYYYFDNEGFITHIDTVATEQDNCTNIAPSDKFNRPKWNGKNWVEGMTDEELIEANQVETKPSSNQVLASTLVKEVADLKKQVADLTAKVGGADKDVSSN